MRTVIFRPTNKCNLRCTYCYDKNNHRCGIESIRKSATELFKKEEENLLESFNKLYEGEDNPKIIFHGGEPLIIDSKVLDDFLEELKEKFGFCYQQRVDATHSAVRFCTSWASTSENVDALCKEIERLANL